MLSSRIAYLRNKAGLSQAALAKLLGVSPSAVGMYEQGRREPSRDLLIAMAQIFDVSTDYLLGRTRYPSPMGNLNQTLAEDYTISDLINTTLSLPSRDVEALLEYVELLKLRGPSDSPR